MVAGNIWGFEKPSYEEGRKLLFQQFNPQGETSTQPKQGDTLDDALAIGKVAFDKVAEGVASAGNAI